MVPEGGWMPRCLRECCTPVLGKSVVEKCGEEVR